MKVFIVVAFLAFFVSFSVFGEVAENKKSDLFNFTPPATTEVKIEKIEEASPPVDTETTVVSKSEVATPALVADAQTLIKDKLVQKYQVRLDEVIGRMTSRMSGISGEEQREALGDLRDRIAEKKDVVSDMGDLDPLKKDILLAILDHVIYRLDGLIKQSAQMQTQAKQA